MIDQADKNGPGVKFPPPLITLALIFIGWLLDQLLALPIAEQTAVAGAILLLASAAFIASITAFQFFQAKTHIEPWKPTSTIITRGVYRYSRNPIYLAFCIATPGAGMLLNSWWVIAMVLPLIYLLQRLVISREEKYLEQKFGQEYLAYRDSVRRWI